MKDKSQENNSRKIKFDEPCICLLELGYNGTKHWWETVKLLESKMESARLQDNLQDDFIYTDAYSITIQDIRFISKNCKAEHYTTSIG